jgi:SAM-dependent methyltransferase
VRADDRADREGPEDPGDGDPLDPYDVVAGTREHYVDAALYDYEYRRRRADVNHYRELAREVAAGGPILELGCGTGRILAPLARDGHRIIGVDLSTDMLARAQTRVGDLGRAARARVELVQGDMRQVAFSTRFPLIICAFNALQHLYARRDLEAFFALVREHLAPGGRFAFDVLMPDLSWLMRDPRKRWARTRCTHPTTGKRFDYTTNHTYDPVTQICHVRIYYEPVLADGDDPAERRTQVVRLTQRQFFPAELATLLAHAGLPMCERWGDFDRSALAADSPSQVIVSRTSSSGDSPTEMR